MCKKVVIAAVLVAAGVIGARAFQRYDGKCCFSKKETSLEQQIGQLRNRLPDLDGEIRKLIGQVAAREVELKQLEADLGQTEKQLDNARSAMLAKEDELKVGASLVKEELKVSPDRQRAVKELNRLADTVERLESGIKARKEQREAFKEALHSCHEQLVAYKNERLALETELAKLDAQVAQMRAEEIKSRVHFDKTKLADMTKRIQQLRTRIEVRQKERELSVKYLGDGSQTTPALSEKEVLERVKRLTSK